MPETRGFTVVGTTSSVLIVSKHLEPRNGQVKVVRPGASLLGSRFDVVFADEDLGREYLDHIKCRIVPGGKFFLIHADQPH